MQQAHAIHYVTKIRNRFSTEPDTYRYDFTDNFAFLLVRAVVMPERFVRSCFHIHRSQ
jgi:hypothetical protein